MKEIIESIKNWLIGYPQLNNWLYINATPIVDGTNSLNTVAGDRVVRESITGIKTHEVVCAIDMVKPYDTGTSDTNMDALGEVDAFAKWIEDNDYPILKENAETKKVQVLTNVPSLLVNQEVGLAKYQFQIKITYESEE